MSKNYINNKDFSNALDEWILERKTNKYAKMSEYIGTCLLNLVNKYASRYNFAGYTYLDVMKTEAIYLAVSYAHNYDSTKANGNAFGYFSRIVENGFKCIINNEKKRAKNKFDHIKYLCDIEGYDYKNYENVYEDENNVIDKM